VWVLVVAGLLGVALLGTALLLTAGQDDGTPRGHATDLPSSTPPTRPASSHTPTAGSTAPTTATSPTSLASGTPGLAGPLPVGTWAGPGLTLVVGEDGASAEFDCAAGTITEQLHVSASGAVRAQGWYAASSGGPVGPSEPPPATQHALWEGTRAAGRLELTIRLSSGTTLGPFSLALGADPQLDKCY